MAILIHIVEIDTDALTLFCLLDREREREKFKLYTAIRQLRRLRKSDHIILAWTLVDKSEHIILALTLQVKNNHKTPTKTDVNILTTNII